MEPSVPAWVVPTQIGKSVPGRLDGGGNYLVPLGFGELVGLTEYPENGHAVDALPAREHGQAPQTLEVQRTVVVKRRGRDVEDGSGK